MSPTAKDLEALHRHLLEAFNPFEDRVVQTPWDPVRYPDVRSIHGSISDEILGLIRRTGGDGVARYAFLRGQPGTGKTHLLRRLRLELGDLGIFLTIRPFGDGRRLHRHILRQISESLDQKKRDGDERTQLQEFALRVLGRAAADLPLEAWVRNRLSRDPAFLVEILRQHTDPVLLRNRVFDRHPGMDRDLVQVVFALLDADRMGMAARWLQGVDMPDEDLALLRVGGSAAEEDRAEEVLHSLIKLSRDAHGFALCFDQLDALPPVEGNPGFVALATAASHLAMAGSVVLILSCLGRTWEEHARLIPAPVVDRITQNVFILERLTRDQIAELIATRLAAVRGPRRPPSSTYPFAPEVATELAAEPGISVRRVLERAARSLEEMRRRKRVVEVRSLVAEPPAVPFETWLDGEARRRLADLRDGGALPLDEGLVKRGIALALDLARRRAVPLGPLRVSALDENPRGTRHLDLVADLAAGAERRRTGLCLCNTENGRSFAAHPQNLLKEMRDLRRQLHAGILIRDERLLPIPSGWKAGSQHLEALQAAGGALVPLDRESLALLEALRTLRNDADAGDLSGPDRPPTPGDVEDAFLRSGDLVRAPLWERLAAALLPQPRGPAPDLAAALVKAVGRHRLLPWSRLRDVLPSSAAGTDLAGALAAARAAPDRILVLDAEGEDPVFAFRP